MDVDTLMSRLPSLVRAGWNRATRSVAPVPGGMNSTTALVDLDDGRFVAKWVRGTGAEVLDRGSALALRLASPELATGEPLLTTAGSLSFALSDGSSLALLRYVPGEVLTGATVREQQQMAATLARLHSVDTMQRPAGLFMSDLLELVHGVEPWVRPAVVAVLVEHARLPPVTWAVIHTDPAPDAFRYDASTGRAGLIDWSGATHGPVLYDVASALMYLGGRARANAFWVAYLDALPASSVELHDHIQAFGRFRGAVQAAYFSMRVATSDFTGIQGQDDNWKGLRDAERMLAELT